MERRRKYYEKNKEYQNLYKKLSRKYNKEKITNEQFREELVKLREEYNISNLQDKRIEKKEENH